MEPKNLLLFFLFQWMIDTAIFASEDDPTYSRSAYFTTRENKQLKGYVVKRLESTSLMSCGQSCLRNLWCSSTNFKAPSKKNGKGICELNKHDSLLINENTNLHEQEGITFSMLLKGCLMTGCLNGGSCLSNEKKQTYSCMCKKPWTGVKCEVKIDVGECASNPCMNNGTCIEGENGYNCSCVPGFKGTQCEIDVDECASQPCKNNGTCSDRVNAYNCSCAPEFNGTQCEEYVGVPCVKAYRMIFPGNSTSDYAIKANAIGSSLSAFTVCFFVKLKDPDTPNGYRCVYSYAVEGSGSPYGNDIYVDLFPTIAIIIGTLPEDATKTKSKIEDDQWHHVCATWENSKGDWKLYMDGQLRENGTGMRKNHVIKSGGTVVFGQDQDKVGGGFQVSDAFGPGELKEVNLWGTVLSASDVAAQHANCTITQASLVHWWDQFKGGVHGKVQVEEP